MFDGKPSCLWVIGATALITVTVNPALGLILGWIAELVRTAIVRHFISKPGFARWIEAIPPKGLEILAKTSIPTFTRCPVHFLRVRLGKPLK